LRKLYGGEAICHTDPLIEKTPEIQAVEDKFKEVLDGFTQISTYHDFRVVAESAEKIIIVADIDVKEDVPESDYKELKKDVSIKVSKKIPNIAYCVFYITPKFAY
jgi:hypothetical protein